MAGTAFTAGAAEIGVNLTNDLGSIQAGTDYYLETPGDYYTYTPQESGIIVFQTRYTGSGSAIFDSYSMAGQDFYNVYFAYQLYPGDDTTAYQLDPTAAPTLESDGWQFLFSGSAGRTYVFGYPSQDTDMKTGFVFQILTDKVEVPPTSITSVEPTPGQMIDISKNKEVLIKAGSAAIESWGKVTFNYNDQSIELGTGDYASFVTTNGNPQFLQVNLTGNVGDVTTDLLAVATNAGATTIKIIAEEVMAGGVLVTGNDADSDYVTVDNGTVTITYPVGEAATYDSAASTWPEIFYNYWEENDPAGMATLVFSGDIEEVSEASVMMGHIDPTSTGGENNVTSYSITPKIDGNKVILDFTNVTRSASVNEVTVVVSSVVGSNGLTVNFDSGVNLYQYITYKNEAAPEPGEEPTYMSAEPNIYYEADLSMPALFIYWTESLEAIDEDVELEATLTTPTGNTITVPCSITTFYPEVEDEPGMGEGSTTVASDNALMIHMNQYVAMYGEGEYAVSIASIVQNAAGEWNQPINNYEFEVTVPAALAQATVTPESGTDFAEGDEVSFTLAYDGVVSLNEDAEQVLYVYEGTDAYELQLDWVNAGNIIYANANADSIIIDLGDELPVGYYNLTFYEGAITVDGVENATEDIMFTVGDPSAIHSIGAGLNGDEVIYNLQGQKVKNPTKGLYIINGKKVLVK